MQCKQMIIGHIVLWGRHGRHGRQHNHHTHQEVSARLAVEYPAYTVLDDLAGQKGVVTTTRSPLPPKPAVRRVSEQAFQARCAPLSKAPHLPMSSKSKPRQTSGARARSPAPASPRHRQAGKKYWAEHCRRSWRRPNLRNTRRSKRHLVLDLKERWARTDCALHPR